MILNKYSKQIIDPAQAKSGARAVSAQLDDRKLSAYIEEATKFDVTPVLTHKLVDDLLSYINDDPAVRPANRVCATLPNLAL